MAHCGTRAGEDSRHRSWRGAHLLLPWQLPIFPISSNPAERREQDRLRHLPFFPSMSEFTQEAEQGKLKNRGGKRSQLLQWALEQGNHKKYSRSNSRLFNSRSPLIVYKPLSNGFSSSSHKALRNVIIVPLLQTQKRRDLPKDIQLGSARNGDRIPSSVSHTCSGACLSLTQAPETQSDFLPQTQAVSRGLGKRLGENLILIPSGQR